MTQETYKGLCIGGPKAGEMFEHNQKDIVLPTPPEAFDAQRMGEDISDTLTFDTHHYRFIKNFAETSGGGNIHAWFHHSIETSAHAREAVLIYYAAGKHPQEDT